MNRNIKTKRTCRRYPYSLYVRVTDAEKRQIEAEARASKLSTSRYLVRRATHEEPLPSEAERQWREHLLFLLHKAASTLQELTELTEKAWLSGTMPPRASVIEGALGAVELLTTEIRKWL